MTDPLRVLTQAEDTAREIRNNAHCCSGTWAAPADVERLANAVAQGFQAIRELIQ